MQLVAETLEAACPHIPHNELTNLLCTRTGTQGTQFPFTVHHLPALWAVCLLAGSRGWEVPQGWSFCNPPGQWGGRGLQSFI